VQWVDLLEGYERSTYAMPVGTISIWPVVKDPYVLIHFPFDDLIVLGVIHWILRMRPIAPMHVPVPKSFFGIVK